MNSNAELKLSQSVQVGWILTNVQDTIPDIAPRPYFKPTSKYIKESYAVEKRSESIFTFWFTE